MLAFQPEQLFLKLADHAIDVLKRLEVALDAIATGDEALEQRMHRRRLRGSVGLGRRHRRNGPAERGALSGPVGVAGASAVTQAL